MSDPWAAFNPQLAPQPAAADPWAAFNPQSAPQAAPSAPIEIGDYYGETPPNPAMAKALGKGYLRGAIIDPLEGIGQLVYHSMPDSVRGLFYDKTPQELDAGLVKEEADYQAGRKAAGMGDMPDAGRLVGNVASPVNLAGVAGVEGTLARTPTAVGRILGRGLGYGATATATQPAGDTGGDYWGTKGEQATVNAGLASILAGGGEALRPFIAPDVFPEARRLYNAGVEVTPTQALGGTVRSLTNKAASLPVVGENIAENTANSLESFQRSRMNQALAYAHQPPMPEDMPLDRNAIEHVSDTISREFQAHIPRTVAGLDQQFNNDIGAMMTRAQQELPEAQFLELQRIGRNYIQQPFGNAIAATGVANVPGEIAQKTDQTLGELSRDLAGENNPAWDRRLGRYVREMQESYRDMLIRGSPPDASQGVQDARRAWAEYVPIRDAAAMQGAEQGRFTPNQYKNAVRNQGLTKEQYATNTGPADYQARQQAAEDAVRVLPNKVPNSGTTDRRAALEGIAALLGAHAIHPGLVGGVAGGIAGTQPAASRLGTWALMAAPETRNAIAQAVLRAPASTVMLGNILQNRGAQ